MLTSDELNILETIVSPANDKDFFGFSAFEVNGLLSTHTCYQ